MIRKAFFMSIEPDAESEYAMRHASVWPELQNVFKTHGVAHYSIFLLPGTGYLFAFALIESEALWADIAKSSECVRWWNYMADLMPLNASGSPEIKVLKEVFYFAREF